MNCSYCSATMPEVSAFCPGCGRSVRQHLETGIAEVTPLSRDSFLGAVAYVGILPSIVFLFLPVLRENRFVRFHAWQSLLLAGCMVVVGIVTKLLFMVLSLFPFLGFLLAWLLAGLVALATLFLWIAIVAKAALGEAYELPFVGERAANLANR
jgi:uncharacterized membrane protein